MSSDENKKIIYEQFQTLPKIIQDTILNSNWQEKIRRIVKNNNLHLDQGAAIENLVLITMLGIETPENFVENAKEYAEVTEEQAYTISNEVEREVFSDIRKKLIEITETANTVDEIERATNELNKVADDIEKEAKDFKPPLRDKIPSDSFSFDVPKINKLPDTPKAPEEKTSNIIKNISEQIDKKPEKEIDPELQSVMADNIMSVKSAESINEVPAERQAPKAELKPIFTPIPKTITPPAPSSEIKLDPYREPIE